MFKLQILIPLAFATLSAQAQQQGGISTRMLQDMEQLQNQRADKALFNAIASNSIDDLARNFANQTDIDTHFSVETPRQSIQNQQKSGRCWMFTGMNVLRADFAKKHADSIQVEFSQAYLFFYDQLEKANLMLQACIDHADKSLDDPRVQFFFKNPIGDGGTFCGVADLADKYGLVPMSVQPETYSSDNTAKVSAIISSKLREYGLELRTMATNKKTDKAIRQRKTEMLAEIYHILSLTIGKPVETFKYAFRNKQGKVVISERTYTPKEFYDLTVGRPLNGSFIMVMNDPRRPYHKTYEVEYDRHTYDGNNWKYLNLPMEDIAQLAIATLKDGKKLYSSYDVGKQLDRKRGYLALNNYDYASLFSTSFTMNKAQRIATFDSGSTHAMTLTAVDLDEAGRPIKWKVENSWGADYGHQGYLIMTNDWWNEYMFRMVVDKEYVSPELLREFYQKPIMVVPEDPLFGMDE